MLTFRRLRLDLLTLAAVFVAVGLVAAISGSSRAPGHDFQVPAPPPVEPVRLDPPDVVQLEPGEAARQAASIREKVPDRPQRPAPTKP